VLNIKESMEQEIANLHRRGLGVLFRFGSGQDLKDSTQVIGQVFQGGITLPDRDYYTKDDAGSKQLRDQHWRCIPITAGATSDSSQKCRGSVDEKGFNFNSLRVPY